MNAHRGVLGALGAGLIILWLVGLGASANHWLTWLDGIAGACSLIVSGVGFESQAGAERYAASWMVGLSVVLFVFWVVALVTPAPTFLVWWTFGFALAYLCAGVAFGVQSTRALPTTHARTV
jgi:hypothetical protein